LACAEARRRCQRAARRQRAMVQEANAGAPARTRHASCLWCRAVTLLNAKRAARCGGSVVRKGRRQWRMRGARPRGSAAMPRYARTRAQQVNQ